MTISPQLLTIFLTAAALTAAAFYSFISHFEQQYNALESRTFDPIFDPTPAPVDAAELPLDAAFLRQIGETQQRRADLN